MSCSCRIKILCLHVQGKYYNIGNVLSTFQSTARSQRDALLDFKQSARVLNDLESNLLY